MLRAVAVIAAAIHIVSPSMGKAARTSYAKTIRATAHKHQLDPLTIVSIAWHESSFRPGAVSPDGEDYGLMQIRARFVKGCRGKDQESKSCKAAKSRLLNGHHSIRSAGAMITRMRKLCRKRTKRSALFHRWMGLYAGLNHPRLRGVWCGQRLVTVGKGRKRRQVWRDIPWRKLRAWRGVREIIDCRRSLIRKRPCRRERRKSRRRSK
jgi:hypothetical protein